MKRLLSTRDCWAPGGRLIGSLNIRAFGDTAYRSAPLEIESRLATPTLLVCLYTVLAGRRKGRRYHDTECQDHGAAVARSTNDRRDH